MSNIALNKDHEIIGIARKCTICSYLPATGWWRGSEDIFCCRQCALDVLPRLIADSLGYLNPTAQKTPELWKKEIYQGFLDAYSLNIKKAWEREYEKNQTHNGVFAKNPYE